MPPDVPIDPQSPQPLSGAEAFTGIDATVLDFWRFAMSDLQVNNVRGYLAEFLVAQAVGSTSKRVEWDAYDVITPDAITVEVKSSAYLQAWTQSAPSKITFSGLKSRAWTPNTGYADEATYNADVYVFAVQTATTHFNYNSLDVGQWLFYVLARAVVASTGSSSLSLSTVAQLAGSATPYADLADTITACGAPSGPTP